MPIPPLRTFLRPLSPKHGNAGRDFLRCPSQPRRQEREDCEETQDFCHRQGQLCVLVLHAGPGEGQELSTRGHAELRGDRPCRPCTSLAWSREGKSTSA